MKIVIITSEFPPDSGGIGTHSFEIAKGLTKKGAIVSVVVPKGKKETKDFDKKQTFKIFRTGKTKMGKMSGAILACKKQKPDLLITEGIQGSFYGYFCSKIFHIPYIAIGHGSEFNYKNYLLNISKILFNSAKKVIAVSNFTKELALKKGFKPKKIIVIHNGADTEFFKPRKTRRKNKTKILLTVGRVCEKKGQDTVIKALKIVKQKIPKIKYKMVGIPEEKEKFSKLAKDAGVTENIEFVGEIEKEKLLNYYNECDVFILNSREDKKGDVESFGIVVAEAGLMEKPVIGTKSTGTKEVIIQNKTGLLIETNNPKETAKAIIKILNSPKLAKKMGKNARKHTLRKFSWKKTVEKIFSEIKDSEANAKN